MRSIQSLLGLMIVVLLAGMTTAAETEDVPSIVVDRWLELGPVATRAPAFGGDRPEGDGAESLLDAAALPEVLEMPREGGTVAGLATSARWHAAGGLQWARPDTTGERGSAVVWLATSITAHRFFSGDLEVSSEHPWKLSVDGVTTEGNDLELEPGAHAIFLASVFDPDSEDAWKLSVNVVGEGARDLDIDIEGDRDLEILDVLEAATVSSFHLSPHGDRVVLTLSEIRPGTDSRASRVELRSTVDGALLQTWRGSPAMAAVRFAPTGNRLSYTTRTGDKTSLWLADLDSGAVDEILHEVEDWAGYRWSPSGDRIVFSLTTEHEADERGVKRLRGLLDRMAGHRDLTELHVVHPESGLRRQLTAGPPSTSVAAFSPDGKRLLVTREVEDLARRPYSVNEVWEIELDSGDCRKLRDFQWLSKVQFSPDGRRLLVQAGPSEFGEAGIAAGLSEPVNDFDGQLFIWDPESDEVEAITRDFDPSVVDAVWSRYDNRIYLLTVNGHERALFVRHPEIAPPDEIDTGMETIDDFAVAVGGTTIVATGTSVWQPQRMVAVPEIGETARVLIEPATDRFTAIRRGGVERWDFTASDGRQVVGRIYYPPSFDRRQRYPAIVNYYGGTAPMDRSFGGRYPAEWWAANGYVVYVLTPTGAYGWGQEISSVHVNDWGEVTSLQIVEAAKAFLESHDFVDPERVGCIGASYGGFMTMKIVTETDLFAAAVAHAGISALTSYWGEGYWGYSYGAVANAESFPWNRRDIFVDRSPLFSANKVSTPVLLTHGDEDPNVPPGESDQFYAALKLLGAEVEYLRIAGLGHLIMEHDKRSLWSKSIVAWFDRWLKDEPGWWDALYPED